LFTSASTVNNLIKLTGPPHPHTLIACIGPSTATAARNAGLRVDIIPSHATSEALVEALATYAQTNPTHPKNT
ncbi:hypothetical protein GZ198_11490, partial [Dermatophilus congolensis]|uniref:uroporphyrinogen-III synthase n=1 Tax=Dermatophilus congolensis TaxID=1863 RepID=UPI001AAEE61A